MNIYVTPDNEEWLREQRGQGNSMSGIINHLLNQRRNMKPQKVANPYGVTTSAEPVIYLDLTRGTATAYTKPEVSK